MAVQMYLVHPKGDDEHREALAEFIAMRQGFILMATSTGSLIAAFDDAYLESVREHSCTEFVGGVSFNPEGAAAKKLQRLFAHNVAQQLTARQQDLHADGGNAGAFPPGYRPLRWLQRNSGES